MIPGKAKKLYSLCKRFLSLPADRKYLLLQTLLIVLVMRAALKFFSLQTILHRLQAVSAGNRGRTPHRVEDIQFAIEAVGRRLSLATCLVNGLAGQYLLGRNGYPATLHIGVKKETDALLAAHAWVAIDQQIVIGMLDDLNTYTILPGIG